MAAKSGNEGGAGSERASSVALPNLHGLNKNTPHPEEWTLPHEWSMEKRELFENWRMDVQNQIANLAMNLQKSLVEYPNPDAGSYFDYQDEFEKAEMEKQKSLFYRYEGATLNYGRQRNPERAYPDKY